MSKNELLKYMYEYISAPVKQTHAPGMDWFLLSSTNQLQEAETLLRT